MSSWRPARRRFLVVLPLLLAACSTPLRVASPDAAVQQEPRATATFVQAFTHGDEATAEKVASPLYREEWNRRGASQDARYAWHAQASASNGSGQWLKLSYVGGITGASGTNHLLYTGLSSNANGTATRTVWRFDTESDGRVIWGEMVYLFSDSASEPTAVRGSSVLQGVTRTTLALYHPLVLVGVQESSSHEGYFALVQNAISRSAAPPDPKAISVAFLAIDSDGIVRPGVWSYRS